MTILTTFLPEQLAGERRERARVRRSLEMWSRLALPAGQAPAAHHKLLISALADVGSGKTDRLMVLMPPGAAKSTYGSVFFPAWWLARHPDSSVIGCAHTASLAFSFASRVRDLVGEHGRRLGLELGGRRARQDFALRGGGSYFAAGVQGAVTGRRADLIMIDDPVRSYEDADSAPRREGLWNWYRADLLTRLKPRGRIVLIMTRWHEDDLGGRLLEREPGWRCVRLPALAEQDDPLGRAPGAALWPDWEDAAALDRKRIAVGERAWAALFQQTPRPEGTLLFKTSAIAVVDRAAPVASVRGWDLAATEAKEGNPDWTVGVKLGREAGGRFVVLDVVRLRGSPHAVECAIIEAAQADGPGTAISLPRDPGQAGKCQALYLTSRLAGYHVGSSPETGSKVTRATPAACQVEAGNLVLLRGAWNQEFLDEIGAFPSGAKNDQVDALSRAFAALTGHGPAARMAHADLFAR